jgi:Fe2+ or Zn2+ uptake regulation protein
VEEAVAEVVDVADVAGATVETVEAVLGLTEVLGVIEVVGRTEGAALGCVCPRPKTSLPAAAAAPMAVTAAKSSRRVSGIGERCYPRLHCGMETSVTTGRHYAHQTMTDVDAPRKDGLHRIVALRLAALDQRYTRSRRLLVEVLALADRPLTVPEILTASPGLPQSSAYRSLTVLIEAGVVHRVAGHDDQGRFELAEELSGRHHHHLVCEGCGRVADIAASPRVERALAEVTRVAAQEAGFQARQHRLDLIGQCADCVSHS